MLQRKEIKNRGYKMIITKRWLIRQQACWEGIDWFLTQKNREPRALLRALIKENQPLEWGNWFLSRKLKRIDKVRYAVYAAKQVLGLFEEEYPNDDRPRKAIKAVEKYIKNPTKKNKEAAEAAARATYAAAYAAAYAVAYAVAYAAYAAYAADAAEVYRGLNDGSWGDQYREKIGWTFDACIETTSAAAYAAADAACAAAYAACAADRTKLQIKICRYGLRLLEKGDKGNG